MGSPSHLPGATGDQCHDPNTPNTACISRAVSDYRENLACPMPDLGAEDRNPPSMSHGCTWAARGC